MINVNLAKEEQNMKILASKNFRQRALIDMMDGMLEKRWEDELRKEVLKPQCMVHVYVFLGLLNTIKIVDFIYS